MEKITRFARENKPVLLIFGAALALRLKFLSPWLEDWDSVQFALALHNYSIVDYQPHAPGYPLYILLGRVLNFFLQNDTFTLTVLSAIFGSLLVFPLFFLTREMFDKKTAIFASLFTIAIPIEWISSESALTNIPGLFFLVLIGYLLYKWKEIPSRIILVSFLAGVMLGVRFTELPILVGILGLILIRQRSIKLGIISLTTFLLGAASWMIPLISITGFEEFKESYGWIANYVIKHDMLLGQKTVSILDILFLRLGNIWYLLNVSYTLYFVFSVFFAIFLTCLFKITFWKEFRYQFIGIWLLAYGTPLLFLYNLEVPRYTLPLLPPMAILAASAFSVLTKKTVFFYFLLISLITVIFLESLSQVKRFRESIPPTIAAVNYVKKNFSPQNAIIGSTFTYRHFQYYAPEFTIFYGEAISQANIEKDKIVVIDYISLKEKNTQLREYNVVQSKEFKGGLDIFPRIPQVTLHILKQEKGDIK